MRNNAFFGRAKLVCVLVCAPRAAKLRHYANLPAGLVVSQRLCCVRVDGLHFVLNYVKRLACSNAFDAAVGNFIHHCIFEKTQVAFLRVGMLSFLES